ncbi:MAG: hypothetical protein A2Z71_09350 [Chloroflexi bacterium RBG_13_50_21]|nr:MAG: hypothetical protein A2Z71_09350 [Chloroflexi bacterium RBG_13_50_21]
MSRSPFVFLGILLFLAACTPASTSTPTPFSSPTEIPPTATPRVRMLPTWTPAPTTTPKPTTTPRPTSTPVIIIGPDSFLYTDRIAHQFAGLLLDRPTFSTLAKPANLVSMQFDASIWSLNTAYSGSFMAYSLTHTANYGCKLEPSMGTSTEGYQVEEYSRALGSTTYEITRLSQAGVLMLVNYCTGEGEDASCYQMTPGSDHEACTTDTESVLATYQLNPNPFMEPIASSPNQWICRDQAGTEGLCLVSYSIPLNALAYTSSGEGWIAGDDGILFHLTNQVWSEVDSPSNYPLYDLSFTSPTDGWAVGAGAQVLRWDGNTWTEVLPFHGPGEGPGGSTQMLYGVDAVSAKEAWMVGNMKGIDGNTQPYALQWDGTDLVEQNAFPECNCSLNAVLSLGKDNILAVGGSDLGAVALHWDGSAWTTTPIQGADALYALSQYTDGTVWAAGIEVARDRSDTRGTLFKWDGFTWQRFSLPPLTGGVYALSVPPSGQAILGGDFTALGSNLTWEPITTSIAGYGWIVDIEIDPQGVVWALTHSGNLFQLEVSN